MKLRSGILAALILSLAASAAHAQQRIQDVIYLKSGGCAYTMDVFKPAKPNGAGVIWMVSGGWFSKHEDINLLLANAFTNAGFTLFQVVHGSQPKYQIPEILVQIKRAVRFVHAKAADYGVDPNRLGISGGSAGGHLSLMMAGTGDDGLANAKDDIDRASSRLKAVGVFFPPTDFENFGGTGSMPYTAPQMQVFLPAFGVTKDTPIEKLKALSHALSPIYTINPKFPPALLIHGDKDMLVPIQQSKIFDEALAKAGIDHQFVTIPGGGHDATTVIRGISKLIAWYTEKLK